MIGAGIRLPPHSLFNVEAVINAVHRAAPAAAIAFEITPEDSADAAARWAQCIPNRHSFHRRPSAHFSGGAGPADDPAYRSSPLRQLPAPTHRSVGWISQWLAGNSPHWSR